MYNISNTQVAEPEIYVGSFFELKDGRLVKTYGANGTSKTVQFYDNDRTYGSASYSEYAQWKRRPDLKDFPNARDPKLPYEFDLHYDVKYMSDLKRELGDADMRGVLMDLMKKHGITIDQVNSYKEIKEAKPFVL